MNTQPIIVTGAHRSGSTWVGRVLSQAPNAAYLHEPFNPIYPFPPSARIDKWFLHIGEHNEAVYKSMVESQLKWNYQGAGRLFGVRSIYQLKLWLKYSVIHMQNRGKRMVLKDPIALFSTKWLVEKMGMRPLFLVRHPAAFAYSLKRKGWGFPFKDILEQEELVENHFSPYKHLLEKYAREEQDILLQASLLWTLMYGYVDEMRTKQPSWLVEKHEDISMDPLTRFEEIFKHFDLLLDDKVLAYIRESTGAQNASGTTSDEENMKRDSRLNVDYWKRKLSKTEIQLVMKSTEAVWPKFYDEKSWG